MGGVGLAPPNVVTYWFLQMGCGHEQPSKLRFQEVSKKVATRA